ncbi:DUF4381 family protein [Pantoea rwandensis]|uniref:DUF4381 domain-containing protein n=1 Tax=Pantoea rwandensis TaxID=1076550 RepID=A0A1X1D667_9GAMM|nr:DUF4381 family protein [Pantoea rwandensis]ORM72136.1 hypothetical protein HA51_03565 [Pantoea rwandensis]
MLAKGFSTPELGHPALPSDPSWFPLPVGWEVLGVILSMLLLGTVLVFSARYRRNRWRREAQKLLPQQSVDDWMVMIKRVLLVQHSRETVSQWHTPEQLLAQTSLDAELQVQMCRRYCQPDNQLDTRTNAQVATQLRQWLESLPHV